MAYSASVIPVDSVKDLVNDNWDTQQGNVPKPNFLIANSGVDATRYNLTQGDWIVFKPDTPTETERPIGTWQFGERKWRIFLELSSKFSRVRLWDMRREVRRICHAQISSMTNFQRIQYVQFIETNVENNQLIWTGRIEIELVSSEILETSY
jgi:hypothetical protein